MENGQVKGPRFGMEGMDEVQKWEKRKKRRAISHQESFTSGPLPPLALWLRLTTVCTHMQTREIYGNYWSSVDLKIGSALQFAHESCIFFQVRDFN